MDISAADVKTLRDETGISIGKCKDALTEASGDMDKAREILKSYSAKAAAKKADRDLGAGLIVSYTHSNGQVGTLVEMNCETDFVTKNEDFVQLANDIAMHITAMGSENKESLMEEPFVKNPELTVGKLLEEATQKIGERIELGSFTRMTVLGA